MKTHEWLSGGSQSMAVSSIVLLNEKETGGRGGARKKATQMRKLVLEKKE